MTTYKHGERVVDGWTYSDNRPRYINPCEYCQRDVRVAPYFWKHKWVAHVDCLEREYNEQKSLDGGLKEAQDKPIQNTSPPSGFESQLVKIMAEIAQDITEMVNIGLDIKTQLAQRNRLLEEKMSDMGDVDASE